MPSYTPLPTASTSSFTRALRPQRHLRRSAIRTLLTTSQSRHPILQANLSAAIAATTTASAARNPCAPIFLRRAGCPYHSYEHPPPTSHSHLEGTVLSAALTHVPALGFSDAALRAGARDAGYTDATASSMFLPGEGAWELVRWHLVSSREGLGAAWRESWEALEEKEDMAEEQRHKVLKARARQLVVERLRMNTRAGLVARMSEALAIMAQPSHVPAALRELAWLADEFCFLAGDTAVDGSWYAKRGALATVYAAAEMFQMQDGSVEQLDTERFVGDRLDEVETLRKRVDGVGEWLGYTGWSVVNGLRSKGVRI